MLECHLAYLFEKKAGNHVLPAFSYKENVMKATKLPSGKYRVQPYFKDANGRVHRPSFISKDKTTALANAHAWKKQMEMGLDIPDKLSFSDAMEFYLKTREAVLSPNTFKEYSSLSRMFKEYYTDLCKKDIHSISNNDIQRIITDLLSEHPARHPLRRQNKALSPKTVRNYVGFISTVLAANNVRIPVVQLPQRKRPEINVPDNPTVTKLLKDVKGTDLEIPVMLAAFGPLRRGEIAALKYPDDFNGNTVHVHASMARSSSGEWIAKQPKTYSSDRHIPLPGFVIKAIKKQGYVTKLTPNQITDAFDKFMDRHKEYSRFRFHDLRHYCVSTLHPIMSDAALMKRGGWSTPTTLQAVYRHTLADQYQDQTDRAMEHFEKIFKGNFS